ncbi:MAG TPA: hypothetical protein VLG11_02490 [Candidatus Saccharimonadales bacterium]|nr:hypothetical protein [Candidatus Saccharimonadales bacterium]
MVEELNDAIANYNTKWKALVEIRRNRRFFAELHPTAVAWKTVDRVEYDKIFAELHELSDVVVESWWDGRWIAMLHLREIKLNNGIEVVKLMQRRPNSKDATGIDHIDFYHPEVAGAEGILLNEPNLKWSHEAGGQAKWISVWFAGTEAKLRTHTIIDSCIRDLAAANDHIKGAK